MDRFTSESREFWPEPSMTENKQSSFFTLAKDVYFERLKIKSKKSHSEQRNYSSKYHRAAALGLCFHCMREDTNPRHHPLQPQFGLCPECMKEKTIGTEKLDY